MAAKKNDDIQIVNTTTEDYDVISLLFKKAMELQGKNGYKVWNDIDEAALKEDTKNKLQYKILRGNEIVAFSVFSLVILLFGVTETRMMQFICAELL